MLGDVGDRRPAQSRRRRRASRPRRGRRGAASRAGRRASRVRSMPPTNATRSSITIVFSWWQWSGPTHESISHAILVCAQSSSRTRRTSWRDGRKSRTGAPPQSSTRTSTRWASSASRFRSTTGSSPRVSWRCGERYQPVRWTCDSAARAPPPSQAAPPSRRSGLRGRSRVAAAPRRGVTVPSASSACSQPTARSRRRWRARTVSSIRSATRLPRVFLSCGPSCPAPTP